MTKYHDTIKGLIKGLLVLERLGDQLTESECLILQEPIVACLRRARWSRHRFLRRSVPESTVASRLGATRWSILESLLCLRPQHPNPCS